MSVDEVERVLLYSLESSVSSDELKRKESLNLITELEQKMENAGPLFQLLLKYRLTQESVSMSIIRILESHLTSRIQANDGTEGFLLVASPIASQLRAAFITDFLQRIVLIEGDQKIKNFLKNSICKFLLTAFVYERLAGTWPNSIQNLLNALKDSPLGREMFMKFCLILTEEISGTVKSDYLSKRNADLRDSMRSSGENGLLCSFWKMILEENASGASSASSDQTSMALECFAGYIGWIDVGLVVEDETLQLIYKSLQSPVASIQLASADCLSEIISKGMPAGEKISLANYMNLRSVFQAVGQRGVLDAFFGKCCRILSNLGTSLALQISVAPASQAPTVQDQVVGYCCPVLLPFLLQFLQVLTVQPRQRSDRLGNEIWEASLGALIPFVMSTFEIIRSMRDSLRPDQISFISNFLGLCVDLLQLSDEDAMEVLRSEAALEEASLGYYGEMRISLLQAFDSVLWLHGHVTVAFINGMRAQQSSIGLGRCEIMTRLVLRLPEGMRGQPAFVFDDDNSHNGGNSNNRMTPIAEVLIWTINEVPKRFPQLLSLVADVLVRYSSTSFLDVFPDSIEPALQLLMQLLEAKRYNHEGDIEKLLKFAKNLKGKLGNYSVALLTAFEPFLNTQSSSAAACPATLYEICGLAVASVDPRLSGIQMDVLVRGCLQGALQNSLSADLLVASSALESLAAFAKGFMSESCLDPQPVRALFTNYVVEALLPQILKRPDLLENTPAAVDFIKSLINLAQRLIPVLQVDSIGFLQSLSFLILQHGSVDLMIQLLPLLAAALFKLRDHFACPDVLGRIWSALLPQLRSMLINKSIQGTDDEINHVALCKAVLSLLHAFSTSPTAMSCTLLYNNDRGVIEEILLNISSGKGCLNFDSIGLIRSLCGVLNRCQGALSLEFLDSQMIPMLLHHSFSQIFRSLDPSCRKSSASLPAAFVNLLQDFIVMLRGLHQQNHTTWRTWNGIDLIGGDAKEVRSTMVNYFLSNCQ